MFYTNFVIHLNFQTITLKQNKKSKFWQNYIFEIIKILQVIDHFQIPLVLKEMNRFIHFSLHLLVLLTLYLVEIECLTLYSTQKRSCDAGQNKYSKIPKMKSREKQAQMCSMTLKQTKPGQIRFILQRSSSIKLGVHCICDEFAALI